MKRQVIYLGSPYSHHNPDVIKRRFNQIAYIAGNIIRDNILVYCPIAHSHPIAKQGIADNWETWKELDIEMLSRCDEMWVTKMSGWEKSTGLHEEIKIAKELGIPVKNTPEKYMKF